MRHATEPNLRCADHGVKLHSRITTDGDGGLVELIEPCQECRRPRFHVKRAAPQPVAPVENGNGHKRRSYNPDRDAEICRRHEAGESKAALAIEFGMSAERIRQIWNARPGRG